MTTPNSTTKGSITAFSWKSFPVEEEKFTVCLVQSGTTKTRDFDNLCEYIKIVFPENFVVHENTESYRNTPPFKKHTILRECVKTNKKDYPKWLETNFLFQEYLHNSHIIVTGEFDDIPHTVLTNSRIIIFESQDDSNKYLQSKHGASLNSFNTETNFIVIDKSIMGHFNIYGLFKKDLVRYDKAHRLSQ